MKPFTPSPHERAFYGESARCIAPESYEEAMDLVREAEAHGTRLVPAGHGAHAYLGAPPPEGCVIVSSRKLDRVLRYEPGDFTIGVQAGLPLEAFRAALAEHDQEVPVDFPRGAPGTVGGLVAAAEPGPRRGRWGSVRAFVIGVVALRGGPSIYKAGGMVVKNVAGYEVMKLLAGALGTAGIILEVNFKLRPLPERRAAARAAFESRAKAWVFAAELRRRRLEPACLWVLDGTAVAWVFEGDRETVAWQESEADALLAASGALSRSVLTGAQFDELYDVLSAVGSPGPEPTATLGIARLSALPTEACRVEEDATAAIGAHDGLALRVASDVLAGLVTVRWEGPAEAIGRPLPALRVAAARGGGGVLVYAPPEIKREHGHLLVPDPNAALAARVLGAFDPRGIFCPGRVLGEKRQVSDTHCSGG